MQAGIILDIMAQRFHFSIRNMMLAMAWVALWCAAVAMRDDQGLLQHLPELLVVNVHVFIVVGMPFIALGTLLGRTREGFIFAVAAFAIVWLIPPDIQ